MGGWILLQIVITAAGFLRFRNDVSFDEKKKGENEYYENDHLKRDNDTSDNDGWTIFFSDKSDI